MNFENIFTHGNLVDVNVSIWTAERKLQPEDLGIESENISEVFSLGRKKLVPPEVIAAIKHLEYRARSVLTRHSFPFQFGQARFVPKKIFIEFAQEMDQIIAEFNQKADEFTTNYERYKREMRQLYVNAANEAYTRANTLCGFSVPRDVYINRFLARVDEFYPDAKTIRGKFHMEYVVFQVSLPDLTQASYEDLAEEGEKVQLMQEAYRQSLYQKIQDFVDKIATDLRSKAATVLQQVAKNLKSGKRVSEATLNSIRKMITDFQRMNIIGDAKLEKYLVDFKTRFLDNYTAKQVREDSSLRKNLYKELSALVELTTDSAAIKAIADAYRQRISL